MSLRVFKYSLPAALLMLLFSCTKEKEIVYELNPVSVSQSGDDKDQPKSTAQFVSIAWQDLFGNNIPQSELVKLNTAYSSFGDKKVVEDAIIRNFLNKPGLNIPGVPAVNGDTIEFIRISYLKFYNREPGVFESHYLREQFRQNAALTPVVFYYALMTSDEYRFY
jgi:hypothetical protein